MLTVLTSRAIEQDSEMMRLQILGDPQLMRELQAVRRPPCTEPDSMTEGASF